MHDLERTTLGGRRAAIALVGAAAVAHGAFLLATRHDPLFRAPDLDEAFYHAWARSLAAGQGDFQGPYFLAPLYPHALALLYRLVGAHLVAARLVQSTLGVVDIALVLALGRRLFGSTSGWLAALLLGLLGPLVFYEGLLLVEVLYLSLVLGALAFLLLPRGQGLWRGIAAGALLGGAALGRGTALLAVPIATVALWRHRRRDASACVAACLLVLAPVAARNAHLGGGWVLTTNSGINLASGNFPGAKGQFHEPEGVHFFRDPVLPNADPRAPLPAGFAARSLTVRTVAGTEHAADSKAWTEVATTWMRTHPIAFVKLLFRKAWLVLQAREEAHLESYDFHRTRLIPLRFFVIDFGWLWPLAGLGAWRAWRERRPAAWIVAGFGATMLATCLIYFVSARYRLAAAPMVTLFAGHGAAALWAWTRARAWRALSRALVPVVVGMALLRLGGAPNAAQRAWEHAQMATRWYTLGDMNQAIAAQERALGFVPGAVEASVDLARYLSERGAPGDLARAETVLRDAARRAPERAVVPYVLGLVLVRQGRVGEARDAWQHALDLDPGFEPARARLRDAARDH